MTSQRAQTPGEKLRAQRERLGLRLIDVARRANVSTGFLSMVETGYTPRRSRSSLERVAAAVELDADVIWPIEEAEDA